MRAALRKFLAMPLGDKWLRLQSELEARLRRTRVGDEERQLDEGRLLRWTGQRDLQALHQAWMERSMPWDRKSLSASELNVQAPDDMALILERAEAAMDGWVCLMGSGPVNIGVPGEVNWYQDAVSGLEWPYVHFHGLNPSDLDRSSDVKFPWELSRLQWLIPVAQAWRLTGDERYAMHVRERLEDWLNKNPTGWGINWACTMEPAIRVITLCWLYQQLGDSKAWSDQRFRFRMQQALFLHLQFIRRHLEITDVNGNHLTADLAALVVAGFLIGGAKAQRWQGLGWTLQQREIGLQVYPDGVDFEGSVPYHRLVAELFHISAVCAQASGDTVAESYQQRLLKMAEFAEAYTRPDGTAPTWGDNDDARTLPLGGQRLTDHRYLPALIRRHWAPETLTDSWEQAKGECLWWWGEAPQDCVPSPKASSQRFEQGGYYLLRSKQDYVFFDCGPLGLAERGGHGHNDMLAFEAVLDGVSLVSDPGCLCYTRDWQARNHFRSTRAHSTVQVGEHEINRFISPRNMWFLHGDAKIRLIEWKDDEHRTLVRGSHDGYERLQPSVAVERCLSLDKENHTLIWRDRLENVVDEDIWIHLQLAPGVSVGECQPSGVQLEAGDRVFTLVWEAASDWQLAMEDSQVAPTYGIGLQACSLHWKLEKKAAQSLLNMVEFAAAIHPSHFVLDSQWAEAQT